MADYDIYEILSKIQTDQKRILERLEELKKPIQYYTPQDIEALLKVSKRTVASWLASKKLPHAKVGAKIWITEGQLKEFLEMYS